MHRRSVDFDSMNETAAHGSHSAGQVVNVSTL